MKRLIVFSVFGLVALCAAAQQPSFDGKTWWRHVEVLAADNMEGRRIAALACGALKLM